LAMNSSNTNRQKNEMLYMRSKIRVLYKIYKQVFKRLYSTLCQDLQQQELILTSRPIRDNKHIAMS
jgi:hypothetical protein